MSKIETELLSHVKTKRKAKEDYQDYALRLIKATDSLSNAEFDDLGQNVQDWINKSIKEIKAKAPIPNFPDAEKATNVSKKTTKKAAKKVNKKTTSKSAPSKPYTFRCKEIMFKNHDITKKDLIAQLEHEGYTISYSTVEVVRADTRQTINVLKSMNLLKG